MTCSAAHDLEDIVNVIASRARIVEEVAHSPADLREYLAARRGELVAIPDFSNYLPGLISDDSSLALTDEVLQRLQVIAKAQG